MNKLCVSTILFLVQSFHVQVSDNTCKTLARSITYITSSQGLIKHDSKNGDSEIKFTDGTISGRQAVSMGIAAVQSDLSQFPALHRPEVLALLKKIDDEHGAFCSHK